MESCQIRILWMSLTVLINNRIHLVLLQLKTSSQLDQHGRVKDLELIWRMRMELGMWEPYSLDPRISQPRSYSIPAQISLQWLVIFVWTLLWVSRNKMSQYSTLPLSFTSLVAKTWESASQLLIFQRHRLLLTDWARMTSNLTTDLPSSLANYLMTGLALIKIRVLV